MELIGILKQTLTITFFVYVMMMLVEYANILSMGKWEAYFCKKGGWQKYIWAGILGVLPGCLGAFAAVTLYSHRIFSIGAIVTVMITTSGDESFVMLAMFPGKSLIFWLALFLIGVVSGYMVDRIGHPNIDKDHRGCDDLVIHSNDASNLVPNHSQLLSQLQNITFTRVILIVSMGLFLLFLITGDIGPAVWNWKRVTFVVLDLAGLWIFLTVPQHFLDHHLWAHITKKHLPTIFGWTFAALLLIGFGERYFQMDKMVSDNELWVMLTSILVGIIPESGPHLLFVTLYAKGLISAATLLASSIVQDGHGMLPLLAVSRLVFLKVKLINVAVGLLVGLTGLLLQSVF